MRETQMEQFYGLLINSEGEVTGRQPFDVDPASVDSYDPKQPCACYAIDAYPGGLEALQAAVGGTFEYHHVTDNSCIVINEEGLYEWPDLNPNPIVRAAGDLWAREHDGEGAQFHGPVLIIARDVGQAESGIMDVRKVATHA